MSKKIIILVFIVLLVGSNNTSVAYIDDMVCSSLCFGNVWYVGGFGPGNFSRIQDAVDNASTGDTVFVFSGNYIEYNISIPVSLQLLGQNASSTIIDGDDRGDILCVYASDVFIQGFTVQKTGWYHDACALRVYADNLTVYEVIFIHDEIAVDVSSTHGSKVMNCSFLYCGVSIRMHQVVDSTVVGNVVETYSFDFAIDLRYSSSNTILQNQFCNYNGWGIYALYSDSNNFTNNVFESCDTGLSFVFSNGSICVGNTFIGNEEGLSVSGSTQNHFQDNEFMYDGVFIYDSYGNLFVDNLVNNKPLMVLEHMSNCVVDEPVGQVILVCCDNVVIANVTIEETNTAIELWNCSDCLISSNTLVNNSRSLYLYSSSMIHIEDNRVSTNKSKIFCHVLEVTNCLNIWVLDNTFFTYDDYNYVLVSSSLDTMLIGNIFVGDSLRVICTHSDGSCIDGNQFGAGGGIRLFACDGCQVTHNIINNGYIELEASDSNQVIGNMITNCSDDYALVVDDSHRNKITLNHIDESIGGIVVYNSRWNRFIKNSVTHCAKLPVWFSNGLLTIWLRNYWGYPSVFPYRIPGEIRISRGWPYPDIVVPVFTFDWFSKRIPPLW